MLGEAVEERALVERVIGRVIGVGRAGARLADAAELAEEQPLLLLQLEEQLRRGEAMGGGEGVCAEARRGG